MTCVFTNLLPRALGKGQHWKFANECVLHPLPTCLSSTCSRLLVWRPHFPKQATLWGHVAQPAPSITFPFVSVSFPQLEGLFLWLCPGWALARRGRSCCPAASRGVGLRKPAEGLSDALWLTAEGWATTPCQGWHRSHWPRKMLWGPQAHSAPTGNPLNVASRS